MENTYEKHPESPEQKASVNLSGQESPEAFNHESLGSEKSREDPSKASEVSKDQSLESLAEESYQKDFQSEPKEDLQGKSQTELKGQTQQDRTFSETAEEAKEELHKSPQETPREQSSEFTKQAKEEPREETPREEPSEFEETKEELLNQVFSESTEPKLHEKDSTELVEETSTVEEELRTENLELKKKLKEYENLVSDKDVEMTTLKGKVESQAQEIQDLKNRLGIFKPPKEPKSFSHGRITQEDKDFWKLVEEPNPKQELNRLEDIPSLNELWIVNMEKRTPNIAQTTKSQGVKPNALNKSRYRKGYHKPLSSKPSQTRLTRKPIQLNSKFN